MENKCKQNLVKLMKLKLRLCTFYAIWTENALGLYISSQGPHRM